MHSQFQGRRSSFAILSLLFILSGCATPSSSHHQPNRNPYANAIPKDIVDEPLSCYGNEDHYVVEGKHYQVLNSAKNYNRVGVASWYGNKFHGHLTSTRERYNMYGMTAASPDLPLPTRVRVTNLENGKSVILKVNDRGPFKSNRIMDVSYLAAKKLGLINNGTAKVRVVALHSAEPPSLDSLASRRVLQVGAFAQKNNATRYSTKITQLTDLPVNIRTVREDNKTFFRVEVGPFENQATLNQTLKNLEEQGVKNIKARYSEMS